MTRPLDAARFLLVDDEWANVAVMVQMLEQLGCVNVVCPPDPCEAHFATTWGTHIWLARISSGSTGEQR